MYFISVNLVFLLDIILEGTVYTSINDDNTIVPNNKNLVVDLSSVVFRGINQVTVVSSAILFLEVGDILHLKIISVDIDNNAYTPRPSGTFDVVGLSSLNYLTQ
jgi:hypothetical protein